jgi:hypothetical protein
MMLLVHMLFGAAIGSRIRNPYLAIPLALLGHYFLDVFPHVEYSVKNVHDRQWRKSAFDMIKIFLDFCGGLALIFFFSHNNPLIYICAFVAIIPDGLTVISLLFPNKISDIHDRMHRGTIHFLRDKKISNFWRISAQVIAVCISLILLR